MFEVSSVQGYLGCKMLKVVKLKRIISEDLQAESLQIGHEKGGGRRWNRKGKKLKENILCVWEV